MNYEEFITAMNEGRYTSTALNRFIAIEVQENHIEVFRYLSDTTSGKAIWVSMESRRRPFYSGPDKFALPKAAFCRHGSLFTEVLQFNRWFLEVMDTAVKVNLGMRNSL